MPQDEETYFSFKKNNKVIYFSESLHAEYILQYIKKTENFYESELLDWVANLDLQDGDILDVGAHMGNHSVYFGKILNRRILSFEPNKKVYPTLKENLDKNNIQGEAFPLAVGDFQGFVSIEAEDESNLGSAHIGKNGKEEVQIVELDTFLPKDIKVSLIKIDVEGYEANVIKGAEKLIERSKPVLLVECISVKALKNIHSMNVIKGYEPVAVFGSTPMVVFCHKDKMNTIPKNAKHQAPYELVKLKIHVAELSRKYHLVTESEEKLKEKLSDIEKEHTKLKLESSRNEEKYRAAQGQLNLVISSKSFKVGNFIIKSVRKVLLNKFTGPLLRRLKALITNKKYTKQTKNQTSIDIYKPPKNKTFELSKDITSDLKNLKVAAIMDEFTYHSFKYECNIQQLTPENWQKEFDHHKPDMLFIESAWRGVDDKWWNTVPRTCKELIDIVKYARLHNIPTVFWNKEDPVHTSTFIKTASLFDYVFTSDIDKVDEYKKILSHNRVFVLPFAAQPKVTNPIEKYDRKPIFSFAGGYYRRYKERMADLKMMTNLYGKKVGLDIYDRNYKKEVDDEQKFPKEYEKYIRGSLPFSEIDKSYKGYKYAFNLNSIKQSPTMFARRVFELIASNTLVVSNYSRGVRLFFGDLVIASDNSVTSEKLFNKITSNVAMEDAVKLIALRKVMSEHTYENRFRYMCSKVFLQVPRTTDNPLVQLFGFPKSVQEANVLLENFNRQLYDNKQLVLVTSSRSVAQNIKNNYKNTIVATEKDVTWDESANYVGKLDINSYYGENYLTDSIHAFKFDESVVVVGKSCYFECNRSKYSLVNEGTHYKKGQFLLPEASIYALASIKKLISPKSLKNYSPNKIKEENRLSNDYFNFCKNVSVSKINQELINAEVDVYSGKSIYEILDYGGKKINPIPLVTDVVVLTNAFPKEGDLYKNAFVKSRVSAYKEAGLNVEVYVFNKDVKGHIYREYDNIDVIEGNHNSLSVLLETIANVNGTVLVHFISQEMWNVLKNSANKIKTIIWAHGYEVQSWKRRQYNFETSRERAEAKSLGKKRMKLWSSIARSDAKIVFVSEYLRDCAKEDLRINFDTNKTEIIHNFIDTEFFSYEKKKSTDAKKILSIRPYANKNYANELAVNAVLELKTYPKFKDLKFTFIGDGKFFDETLNPIKDFKNVEIRKEFVEKEEIKKLHKEHGIFLVPTRMDTQGVSRDEAMSSGLVPITNKVAAVPEFVSPEEGVLAEPEDSSGLAEGIKVLIENRHKYQTMSENSAKRVRNTSSYEQTIKKEINIIMKKDK